MEISIKRSPQHLCASEGSNSELCAHDNEAVTARPHDVSIANENNESIMSQLSL